MMLRHRLLCSSKLYSEGVKELMSRVRKVVSTMPRQSDLELFTVRGVSFMNTESYKHFSWSK